MFVVLGAGGFVWLLPWLFFVSEERRDYANNRAQPQSTEQFRIAPIVRTNPPSGAFCSEHSLITTLFIFA